MRYCVMVARQTLTLFVWVQILVPQPKRDLGISGVSSYRGVAQFGRALRSGRRSRRFKSSHLDQTCGEQFAHRRFSFAISFAPAAECLRWRFAFKAGAGNNPIPHRAARNQLIYTSLWKGSARFQAGGQSGSLPNACINRKSQQLASNCWLQPVEKPAPAIKPEQVLGLQTGTKREKAAKCQACFRAIRIVCRHPAQDGGRSISRWPVFSDSWQQI